MRTQTLIVLFVSMMTLVSCGKDSASSKINKSNLETAMNRDKEFKKGSAAISFTTSEYDFGTVNEGDVVETSFELTNTGKTDLIISDAKGSCGCTVPEWPKNPIKPGDKAKVLVKFNTSGKPNRQIKTVTLYTNTEKGRETLRLKGVVTPKSNS